MKNLLPILIVLLLTACSPNNPSPNYKPTTSSKTSAILKLDTKGHTARINDIIVTKSGDIISASDDKTIRVWSSTTGAEKRKILGQIGAGMEGKIYAIALSPNEKFLAIGGFLGSYTGKKAREDEEAHKIRIYNYQTGKLLKVLKSHKNVVFDLAFSSDGRYLISGSADTTAKIWDTKSFRVVDTIGSHTNYVYAVKIIKKNSKYFALTAGYDNRVTLYDMQSKKVIRSDQKAYKLAFLATSKNHIALSGFGKEIQIYDYALNPIKTIASETSPKGLAYSPNGDFLIAGAGAYPDNVNIYSVKESYKRVQSFKKHKNLTKAVAFLDNHRAISGGGNNSEIYIWDIDTLEVKEKIVGVGRRVWSVGLLGDKIAWGNKWTARKGKSRLQKSINLKNFSIQNSLKDAKNYHRVPTSRGQYRLSHKAGGAYGYADATLELKKGSKLLASITRDATNGLEHMCYGFYKNYIISGGANGALKIYNLRGQEVANLVGHTGVVWSIAIDGDRLVSGSSDQTIRVWDLSRLKREMRPQLNIFVSKSNEWVVWTKEGFYNASKGAEQYIGYHINQGADKEAKFLDVSRFRKQFYRPDLIQKAINGEDISSYAKGININELLTTGLPPRVEILTESDTINGDSTTIGVDVCDEGGGVENLNFYVDNKPIKYISGTKAFRERKESKIEGCMTIEQRISIPSGRHTIAFDATNKEGNIVSNRPTITIVNNKKVERKPNLHLLTLSINDYRDNSLDLKFPNNDADKLSQKLKEIGKPIFETVNTYELKDSQVTKEQIEAKVKEIAQKVKADDVFVLYISGHGVTSKRDGDYYFIPYNCANGADVTKEAINQKIFKQIMSQIKAVKSVILLDTCQSGSMASKELLSTSVNRFGGNVGSAIIAGASSRQNAIDGYKQHGIFTYTILDAMNNKKVYSFDDKLSINEIAEYVKYMLPKIAKEAFSHEQKPTIYLNGDTTFAIGGI